MAKKSILYSLIPIYLIILSFVIVVASAGNQAVTAISENLSADNRPCVIIDAGHGGMDGGATSCTGVLESTINLNIANRLNELVQLVGFRSVMIRKTDCSVYTEGNSIASKKVSDLKNRVKIVNQINEALLISIHQNYYTDNRYSGAQVFYADTKGSAALANTMQAMFVNTLNKGSNRKAKKANGVYLMQHIRCTGVLVECGFISNAVEEQKLMNAEYQKKICCVIVSACSKHLSNSTA